MATEALDPPGQPAFSATARPSSLLAVLSAPLDAIVRPARTARVLADARPAAFLCVFAALCGTYGVALGCIPIFARILTALPAEIGFVEGWRRVNRGQAIGPVEVAFVIGLCLPFVITSLATWLMLSRTLRSEPVMRAVSRMFRAQFTIVPFALLFGLSIFAVALFTGVAGNAWLFDLLSVYFPPEAVAAISTMLLLLWLSWRIEVAATALEEYGVAPLHPAQCESCGYDLTHTASDGRCTECGRRVSESLVPGVARRGCDWENDPRRSRASWLRTTWEVFVRPRRFYESLLMYTDLDAARRFALLHSRWIGIAAAIWIVVVNFIEWGLRSGSGRPSYYETYSLISIALVLGLALGTPLGRFTAWRPRALLWLAPAVTSIVLLRPTFGPERIREGEIFWLAAMALCMAPLICWIGHRVGGAVVSSIAIFFRFLPDYRRAEKVILYETGMLWVYCSVWGVLVTSFILFGTWMMQSPLLKWIWHAFGIMPESFTVLASTAVISVLWARRYLIAFRAVRWANF